jgi:hypothetical protein
MKICGRCKRNLDGSMYDLRNNGRIKKTICKECCSVAMIEYKRKREDKKEADRTLLAQGLWTCSACRKIKPLSEFWFYKWQRVPNRMCSPCKAKYNAARRQRMTQDQKDAIYKRQSDLDKQHPDTLLQKRMILRHRAQLKRIVDRTVEKREVSKKFVHTALGCSFGEFREYIESQFAKGMTWDNCGAWHIDHIIPLCKFNPDNHAEYAKAWHYSNMRPLWAHDNLSRKRIETIEHQPALLLKTS